MKKCLIDFQPVHCRANCNSHFYNGRSGVRCYVRDRLDAEAVGVLCNDCACGVMDCARLLVMYQRAGVARVIKDRA